MSSREGFTRADIDSAQLSDSKVVALARILRDSIRTGAAMTLYNAVLLGSWREGTRLRLDEAAPAWWTDPWDDLADALVQARLLDDEQRIPQHAWEAWYGVAFGRVLDSRRKAIYGGLVSHGMSQKEANAEADRRVAEIRRQAIQADLDSPTSYQPTNQPTNQRAREADRPNGVSPDWYDIAEAVEVWTGQAYALGNPSSKLGERVIAMLAKHGKQSVIAAMTSVSSEVGQFPTVNQLVLGAGNILDPIPKAPNETEREAKAERESKRTSAVRELDYQRSLQQTPRPTQSIGELLPGVAERLVKKGEGA